MSSGTFGRNRSSTRSWYARLLRLQHLRLRGVRAMLLCEGSVVVAILCGFAELAPWWGVPAIPLAVAAMVKLNDTLAGQLAPATTVVAVRSQRRRRIARTGAHTAVDGVRRRAFVPPVGGYRTGGAHAAATAHADEPTELLPTALPPRQAGGWDSGGWDWRIRQSAAHHYD